MSGIKIVGQIIFILLIWLVTFPFYIIGALCCYSELAFVAGKEKANDSLEWLADSYVVKMELKRREEIPE